MKVLALVTLLGIASRTASGITEAQYNAALSTMSTYFRTNGNHLPTAVRLAFHDCVGGCDGCINLDNGSNDGLADVIDALEIEYQKVVGDGWERGDFWAMSAIAAIQRGIIINNRGLNCPGDAECMPSFEPTFKQGRQSCASATAPQTTDVHDFPNPKMSNADVMTYFKSKFPTMTTDREIVALMGAHTLGDCRRENSGYSGPWIVGNQATRIFDNEYFILMYQTSLANSFATYTSNNNARGRNSDTVENARFQWNGLNNADGTGTGMMLNTDFEMFYDLGQAENGEPQNCATLPGNCPQASTFNDAKDFAESKTTFGTEFQAVFTKMIETTSSTLSGLD